MTESTDPATPAPATSPVRRAWVATALMEALFAVLYLPSLAIYLLPTVNWTGEDPPQGPDETLYASGLAIMMVAVFLLLVVIVYSSAALVLIPAVAHTLGRYIDGRTRHWRSSRAALVFAGVAAAPGLVVVVPAVINDPWAALLALQLVAVPALAAFGTRLLLPVALRVKAVRVLAIVLGALAVALPVWLVGWFLVAGAW